MTREAELELEIARLREALEYIADSLITLKDSFAERGARPTDVIKRNMWDLAWASYEKLFDAYNTSPSTTALQELINEVERRTIERCLDAVNPDDYPNEDDKHVVLGCRLEIRALPTGNLKLEDLK